MAAVATVGIARRPHGAATTVPRGTGAATVATVTTAAVGSRGPGWGSTAGPTGTPVSSGAAAAPVPAVLTLAVVDSGYPRSPVRTSATVATVRSRASVTASAAIPRQRAAFSTSATRASGSARLTSPTGDTRVSGVRPGRPRRTVTAVTATATVTE